MICSYHLPPSSWYAMIRTWFCAIPHPTSGFSFVSLSMPVCLSVCLSVSLSLSLSVCLSVRQAVCLSIHRQEHCSIALSVLSWKIRNCSRDHVPVCLVLRRLFKRSCTGLFSATQVVHCAHHDVLSPAASLHNHALFISYISTPPFVSFSRQHRLRGRVERI